MKKFPLLFIIFLSTTFTPSFAQSPDWSTRIASIVYNNCSSCHHDGAIAPFALMSFQDAVDNASDIRTVVLDREMPPWPADPAYRHFAYEAVLDSAEIADIIDWIDNGTLQGDTTLAPAPPVYLPAGSVLDTIHFTVQIPPYTLQYNTDEYRYFAMHTGFTDTVYVSKIEVIPGLASVVHHADIHYDLSGVSFYNDSITPLPGFSGGMVSDYYMNAWQPGGNIAEYPPNWGIRVPPGADFVLEIHYGPGGQGLTDTTLMNLQFIVNPVNVRPIHVGWLLNNPIPSQGPLVIPPNVITTFNQVSAPMPADRSIISICPHMHLLGNSYMVWYIDMAGDSVPLIDIPHWDFHWQKYYMFQQVQKIPAGARLHSVASFDNTVNNPHNPNNPPITVSYGPTTTDEMLMTYFIWADYEAGDENIVLDTTLIVTSTSELLLNKNNFKVFPNPSAAEFSFSFTATQPGLFYLEVFDLMGRTIFEKSMPVSKGVNKLSLTLEQYPDGMYVAVIKSSEGNSACKILKCGK